MSRLIGSISGCFEEVSALDGVEHVADVLESIAKVIEGSGGMLSEQRLELCEGHLDRVEIGRIGRQRQHPGAALAYQFGGALAFVEGDIVVDDDIAWRQFGRELSFDIQLEASHVHRRIDDPWRDHAMAAQAGDEGLRLPPPERRMRPVALTLGRPAGALGQLGVCRRLIDKDQALQGAIEEWLASRDPERALLADVRALLFTGLKGLFL